VRLGEWLRAIDGYTGREVIAIALKLALLFFVRPGELRKTRWRQFDLAAAQWRIPAECMKARVQHLVPLSRQALELLQKLRTISGNSEYVFASLRDLMMQAWANYLDELRTSGSTGPHTAPPLAAPCKHWALKAVTPHGFRSTACTLINELGWRSEASSGRWLTASQTPSVDTTAMRNTSRSAAHGHATLN
jgi:integrase